MNILKKLSATFLIVFLAFGQVTSIPMGNVFGGENLSSAGAIAYVASSGTLTSNSSFTWNGTYLFFPQNMGFGWSASDRFTANTGGGGFLRLTAAGTTIYNLDRDSLSWAFGKSNTTTGSTVHIKDATASTGTTLVTIARGAGQTASSTVLTMDGVPQFGGTNTTGAGSALLGANSPATTNTAPYTWIRIVTSDGSTAYIPAWK